MPWKNSLEAAFPQCLSASELARKARTHLGQVGFNSENLLFANITCRDELNQGFVRTFENDWGENFTLAGLGGYPSAGVTGFGAYSHHAPDNGGLLILYGPHIGIDDHGQVGKVLRPGMSQATTACGALIGFLGKIQAQTGYRVKDDALDIEQNALERELQPHARTILEARDPVMEVTNQAYEIIDQRTREILQRSNYQGPTVLLGGIVINTPTGYQDYFQPRRAVLLNCERVPGGSESWLEALNN